LNNRRPRLPLRLLGAGENFLGEVEIYCLINRLRPQARSQRRCPAATFHGLAKIILQRIIDRISMHLLALVQLARIMASVEGAFERPRVGEVGMIFRAFLAFIMALSFAAAAEAAVVTSIEGEGEASVDRGGGFQALQTGATLKPGDRVLAGRRSRVAIQFAPNCGTWVLWGESFVVPEDPGCDAAAYTEAAGPREMTQAELLGYSLLGAGAAIGIGGIIALAVGDNDANKVGPASP
jgi:hypothetical protein